MTDEPAARPGRQAEGRAGAALAPRPTGPGGLVPSAITAHGTTVDVDGLYRPAFPSTELVGAAAAMFTALPAPAAGPDAQLREGPTWRVTVSPGTVQVGTVDYARAERTHEREEQGRQRTIDVRVGGCECVAGECVCPRSPPRGRVTYWSNKSRARMIKTLSDLDWSPMFAAGGIPAMITLTLPGDWLSVFPDAATAVAAVKTFRLRWRRSWGVDLVGPWKREFQRRGAWHLHVLCVPPRGRSDARFAHGGLTFRQWLSRTWTDVLDGSVRKLTDGAHGLAVDEYDKSLRAGTGVDFAEGLRATDPRRIAVYFTGHGLEKDKEYQNRPPDEWVDVGGVGRWWGYWGLRPYRAVVELAPADAVAAARVMRRWSRSRRYWRTARRSRVERTTGRVRDRATTVRVWQVRRGRGWVSINDGPAFAADVARAVEIMRRE
jgi:hypothetical protein